MKVVLLGTGNVAYHLANALSKNSALDIGVCGRSPEKIEYLQALLPSSIRFYCDTLPQSDVYLLAVSDDAIADVAAHLPQSNALVLHTSGSQSIQCLLPHVHRGVFYPMQTFSLAAQLDYAQIPVFYDCAQPEDETKIKLLASSFTDKISPAHDEQRKYLHITAVFVCNFVNHLFARGQEIAAEHQLPFAYFHPLVEETVKKIKHHSPQDVQTGPARRGDTSVVQSHVRLLHGVHREIYQMLSNSIKEMYEL